MEILQSMSEDTIVFSSLYTNYETYLKNDNPKKRHGIWKIEKETKKLNNKEFTKLFLKVSQTQKIGRKRLRRKTTQSSHKRQGINTIKYNLLKEWGLLKYVDVYSMSRLFKVSKTNKVIGRNYLVKRT